jgi:putative transposase
VVVLALATACLVGAAIGPCKGKGCGETELLRSLLDRFHSGDLVVADRYYCTWWLIALLADRGVDACFRLHHKRHYDFSKGRQLGNGDHVVQWAKPDRPEWMDEQMYQGLPAFVEVREVQVVVKQRGFRVQRFVAATTLLDSGRYSSEDIADLYHHRWHVELDIRNIKQTLQMDILSCKTPAMVRREVWAHLLAYNLVRKVLAQAALAGQVTPRQLSFAGAVDTMDAFRWVLAIWPAGDSSRMVQVLLAAVATHRVGNRPDRVEPREVKRRRAGLKFMMKTRAERRAELLAGIGA